MPIPLSDCQTEARESVAKVSDSTPAVGYTILGAVSFYPNPISMIAGGLSAGWGGNKLVDSKMFEAALKQCETGNDLIRSHRDTPLPLPDCATSAEDTVNQISNTGTGVTNALAGALAGRHLGVLGAAAGGAGGAVGGGSYVASQMHNAAFTQCRRDYDEMLMQSGHKVYVPPKPSPIIPGTTPEYVPPVQQSLPPAPVKPGRPR